MVHQEVLDEITTKINLLKETPNTNTTEELLIITEVIEELMFFLKNSFIKEKVTLQLLIAYNKLRTKINPEYKEILQMLISYLEEVQFSLETFKFIKEELKIIKKTKQFTNLIDLYLMYETIVNMRENRKERIEEISNTAIFLASGVNYYSNKNIPNYYENKKDELEKTMTRIKSMKKD